jgi:predicted Fe-Mo cluster-binding NifX family protein
MKIAISAKGRMPTSNVAPFSGRNAGFVIYDSDNLGFTYLNNPTKSAHPQCSGSQPAQLFINAGIDVLVVGGIALEAAQLLGRSGIRIYECISATVWEAIQALKLNLLQAIDNDSTCPDYREVSSVK